MCGFARVPSSVLTQKRTVSGTGSAVTYARRAPAAGFPRKHAGAALGEVWGSEGTTSISPRQLLNSPKSPNFSITVSGSPALRKEMNLLSMSPYRILLHSPFL